MQIRLVIKKGDVRAQVQHMKIKSAMLHLTSAIQHSGKKHELSVNLTTASLISYKQE